MAKKKGFHVLVIMALIMVITTSVAYAETRSRWIPSAKYPRIDHQTVNRFGGSGWDGVRWANNRSNRVRITVKFFYLPTKDKEAVYLAEQVVYVRGGMWSKILDLEPGVWFDFTVVDED